ncbi:YggT family protein [Terasakiella brassicae]|uniref:YggT family protein n=1 Tax=Terasakiella brassicae TaxID=1634917 RepID=A0A917C1H2_9PROT|nr:YggT family protein [Terasakiella brassicae]GGF66161.1 YggT family protein [Terasakiella brassicae]
MDVVLVPLFQVLLAILNIYELIVVVTVVMSWLFHFNVINYSNQFVRIVWDICSKLTEPLLSRIRQFLPDMGGIDLSPIVLLLVVFFLQSVVQQLMFKLV